MNPRPVAPPGSSRITADEPCLPPHTTPRIRHLRRRFFPAHPVAFLLLAACVGALVASLLGLVR